MKAHGGMEVWFHAFLTLALHQRSTIFRKSRSYDQMLGARRVTQNKFHVEHPHSGVTCEPHCCLALSACCMWTDAYFCLYGKQNCNNYAENIRCHLADRDLCTFALDGVQWLDSRQCSFNPGERDHNTHCIESWVSNKSGLDALEESPLCTCRELKKKSLQYSS